MPPRKKTVAPEVPEAVAAQAPEPAPAPRDHNQPPEPIMQPGLGMTPEEWFKWMAHVFEQPDQRLEELLEMDARFKVGFPLSKPVVPGEPPIGIEKWDDEVQGKVAKMRDLFRGLMQIADSHHTIQKQPTLQASRAIDGYYNQFMDKIGAWDSKKRLIPGADRPLNRIQERSTIYAIWKAEESQRAAKAEADRLAREAQARTDEAVRTMEPEALQDAARTMVEAERAMDAARAPVAEHSRVHSDTGVAISLTTRWKFFPERSALLDLVKAVAAGDASLEYLDFNETRINYAVRSEKVRAIPGCVIEPESKT